MPSKNRPGLQKLGDFFATKSNGDVASRRVRASILPETTPKKKDSKRLIPPATSRLSASSEIADTKELETTSCQLLTAMVVEAPCPVQNSMSTSFRPEEKQETKQYATVTEQASNIKSSHVDTLPNQTILYASSVFFSTPKPVVSSAERLELQELKKIKLPPFPQRFYKELAQTFFTQTIFKDKTVLEKHPSNRLLFLDLFNLFENVFLDKMNKWCPSPHLATNTFVGALLLPTHNDPNKLAHAGYDFAAQQFQKSKSERYQLAVKILARLLDDWQVLCKSSQAFFSPVVSKPATQELRKLGFISHKMISTLRLEPFDIDDSMFTTPKIRENLKDKQFSGAAIAAEKASSVEQKQLLVYLIHCFNKIDCLAEGQIQKPEQQPDGEFGFSSLSNF